MVKSAVQHAMDWYVALYVVEEQGSTYSTQIYTQSTCVMMHQYVAYFCVVCNSIHCTPILVSHQHWYHISTVNTAKQKQQQHCSQGKCACVWCAGYEMELGPADPLRGGPNPLEGIW